MMRKKCHEMIKSMEKMHEMDEKSEFIILIVLSAGHPSKKLLAFL